MTTYKRFEDGILGVLTEYIATFKEVHGYAPNYSLGFDGEKGVVSVFGILVTATQLRDAIRTIKAMDRNAKTISQLIRRFAPVNIPKHFVRPPNESATPSRGQ